MSNCAVKVRIDGTRYLVKGVSQETSKKDLLCALAKLKSTEQSSNLEHGLSKSLGNFCIIECKSTHERRISSSGISSGESDVRSKRSDAKSKRSDVTILDATKKSRGRRRDSFRESKKKDSKLQCILEKSMVSDPNASVNKSSKTLRQRNIDNFGDSLSEKDPFKRKSALRSISLSEKNSEKCNRKTRKYIGDRPKSFNEFDFGGVSKFENSNLKRSLSLNEKTRKNKNKNSDRRKSYDDSDLEISKRNNRRYKILLSKKNYDDSDVMSLCEIENSAKTAVRRIKTQTRRSKLTCWLDGLKQNSTTYFIESPVVTNAEELLVNAKSVCRKTDENNNERTEHHSCFEALRILENEKRNSDATSRNLDQSLEDVLDYPEAETDSGLPSLDYESSLDTISRDDRISFDHASGSDHIFTEGRPGWRQQLNDSGIDSASLKSSLTSSNIDKSNQTSDLVFDRELCHADEFDCDMCGNGNVGVECESKVAKIKVHNCRGQEDISKKVDDAKLHNIDCKNSTGPKVYSCKELEDTAGAEIVSDIRDECCCADSTFEDLGLLDDSSVVKVNKMFLVEENKNESSVEELETLCKEMAEINDQILHNELLVAQLEYQLGFLSEEIDNFDEFDIQNEELKLISELKEVEEFFSSIAQLNHYQREAHDEIFRELIFVDAKLKEKSAKLQSLQRRLRRNKYRTVPRHLSLCEQKKRFVSTLLIRHDHELEMNTDVSAQFEIRTLDFTEEETSVSLV